MTVLIAGIGRLCSYGMPVLHPCFWVHLRSDGLGIGILLTSRAL